MYIHSDFLTTSSPAEGKIPRLKVTAALRECSRRVWSVLFGFDSVFHLTDFGSCQDEVATCGEAETQYMYTRFGQIVQIQQNQNLGSLQEPGFSRKG